LKPKHHIQSKLDGTRNISKPLGHYETIFHYLAGSKATRFVSCSAKRQQQQIHTRRAHRKERTTKVYHTRLFSSELSSGLLIQQGPCRQRRPLPRLSLRTNNPAVHKCQRRVASVSCCCAFLVLNSRGLSILEVGPSIVAHKSFWVKVHHRASTS